MPDQSSQDKRVENLKERLHDDLVDEHGNPVAEAEVARVVDAAAAPLGDAPVQEFLPLLIEHEARDALRDEGFRRDLADEGDDDAPAIHDRVDTADDEGEALHLSTQQGFATPGPEASG